LVGADVGLTEGSGEGAAEVVVEAVTGTGSMLKVGATTGTVAGSRVKGNTRGEGEPRAFSKHNSNTHLKLYFGIKKV
jgi:hypothetical protein